MLYVIAVWFSLIVQLQNTGVKCLCSVQDNQKQYRFGAKVATGPGWATLWRATWSGHSWGIISLNCRPRPQNICLCLKRPQTGFCQPLCTLAFGCQSVFVFMSMIICVHKSVWSVQWLAMALVRCNLSYDNVCHITAQREPHSADMAQSVMPRTRKV